MQCALIPFTLCCIWSNTEAHSCTDFLSLCFSLLSLLTGGPCHLGFCWSLLVCTQRICRDWTSVQIIMLGINITYTTVGFISMRGWSARASQRISIQCAKPSIIFRLYLTMNWPPTGFLSSNSRRFELLVWTISLYFGWWFGYTCAVHRSDARMYNYCLLEGLSPVFGDCFAHISGLHT